jgi:hypothetical protein
LGRSVIGTGVEPQKNSHPAGTPEDFICGVIKGLRYPSTAALVNKKAIFISGPAFAFWR